MRVGSWPQMLCVAVIAASTVPAQAEDKQETPKPRITAISPLAVASGSKATLRLRGTKLDGVTEVRFPGAKVAIAVELKEKKKADLPTGMDAKDIGDTQTEVSLTLPPDLPAGPLAIEAVTPDGVTPVRELRMVEAAALREEKEPNGGFREAQPIGFGQVVSGTVKEDKDVDMFTFSGHAQEAIRVEIAAAKRGSLLDPVLTLFDEKARVLATSDDAASDNRDAQLSATLPADGKYFLSIVDANERGTAWHSYELSLTKPVSFAREVMPILKHNCNGCHRPGKTKGGLDLTTFAALLKGGKNGASVAAGKAHESAMWEQITGDEPEMPKDGDPLTAEEVTTIERWIAQGASDDTVAGAATHKLAAPPQYRALPAVSALAWSPDGGTLAVSGFHEVVLHDGEDGQMIGRLVGESPRVESLAFSTDGKLLAVAGGAPSEYGEIQLWDMAKRQLVRSIKTTTDSVYGVSFSPDGTRVAVGCADKTVRAFSVADGKEVMKCDNHIDWVFGTAFSLDGAKLATASRDRAVKLIDVASGQLIDDIAIPREPVLSLARHPKEDLIVEGCETGAIRVYKMAPRGGRLAEGDNKENSYVRDLERLPGHVHAIIFSADGARIAAGCATGEARIFSSTDGKRIATIKAGEGAIFAVAFHPAGKEVAVSGSDGKVRVFAADSGKLEREFDSVPLVPATVAMSP